MSPTWFVFQWLRRLAIDGAHRFRRRYPCGLGLCPGSTAFLLIYIICITQSTAGACLNKRVCVTVRTRSERGEVWLPAVRRPLVSSSELKMHKIENGNLFYSPPPMSAGGAPCNHRRKHTQYTADTYETCTYLWGRYNGKDPVSW